MKNKYRNNSFTEVYTPLNQYYVKPPLAAITAVSLSGKVSKSFPRLDCATFSHYSLSNWLLIIASLSFSGLAIYFQVRLSKKRNSDTAQCVKIYFGPAENVSYFGEPLLLRKRVPGKTLGHVSPKAKACAHFSAAIGSKPSLGGRDARRSVCVHLLTYCQF